MRAEQADFRILVVGGGSIGERHARCFLATGRCAVAVCDVNDALRARLAERYALAGTHPALDAALAEPWDAAVLATPAHLHVAQALELAEQGIPLFIEKPLGTTLRGVAELRAAVRERALVVNVGYVYRAHPAMAALKACLETGELGPIRHVTVTSGQHFPTYRPAYREIYYARRATGGGAVQDALTHLANAVQHLAGFYDWVFADYAHQVLEGVEVEDTVNLVGRLSGGRVLAGITLNQFMAPNETTLAVHCDHGSARLEMHRHRWALFPRGAEEWRLEPATIRERDDLFVRQAAAFLAALEGRAPVLCSLEEAEHTLRVNLAALRSGAGGEAVRIDAVDESFDPARS